MRDTPALAVIQGLITRGYKNIYAYDPIANKIFENAYGHIININYCETVAATLDKCDIIVLVTKWSEFENIEIDNSKTFVSLRY